PAKVGAADQLRACTAVACVCVAGGSQPAAAVAAVRRHRLAGMPFCHRPTGSIHLHSAVAAAGPDSGGHGDEPTVVSTQWHHWPVARWRRHRSGGLKAAYATDAATFLVPIYAIVKLRPMPPQGG